MQWDLKKSAGLLVVTAVLAGVGVADARRARIDQWDKPKAAKGAKQLNAQAQMAAPDAEPQGLIPQNIVMYDEVGYAGIVDDATSGQATANGDAYNAASISAAHASLPLPTYVEITDLNTGRTILARVNDRPQASGGQLVALSTGAARLLGVEGQGATPVRVRRVNPPEQEKAALRAGVKGADRLDTPTQLLTALRKKLGAGPMTPRVATAAAAPIKPATGAVYAPSVVGDDGFVIEESGQRRSTQVAASKPAVKPTAPTKGRPGATFAPPVIGDDGFIVEDAGQRSKAVAAAVSRANGGSGYFVQVAAFSNEARARSTAQATGSGITRAGNVWRVRKGPYDTESSARAALGPIVAKGYRDARIAR